MVAYVLSVHAAALVVLILTAERTRWSPRDAAVCGVLLCCAAVTIEVTRRIGVAHGSVFHDMQAVWY
ncbi:MAG TPA: hypothetical protein VN969_26985, partial [Streptosporangiaceae bacterium]|nr:hypothetical protein [Streptosporangiaceae bacterium]